MIRPRPYVERIVYHSILYFLFLFGQSLHIKAQNADNLPFFKDYDVNYYDLEIQISDQMPRIAGTLKIHFVPQKRIQKLWLNIGPEIQIARMTFQGKPIEYEFLGEILSIQFPYMLPPHRDMNVEMIFYGKLEGSSAYPVWEKNGEGDIQISFTPSRIPPSNWWPCKMVGDNIADSLKLSVIFPRGHKILTSGIEGEDEKLPGNLVKKSFYHHFPVSPENVRLFIGNFQIIRDYYENERGEHELVYFVQPEKRLEAQGHLRQVKQVVKSLEKYLGPYDSRGNSYTWFQPLSDSNEPLVKNNKWSFDPILVRDISRQWVGHTAEPKDSLDSWLMNSFPHYTEGLIIKSWYDQETAHQYYSNTSSSHFHKGAAILHSVQKYVNNDEKWFEVLIQYLEETPQDQTFEEYLDYYFGPPVGSILAEYRNLPNPPVLEYSISRRSRKLQFSFRWTTENPFQLPVYIEIMGTREVIFPSQNWQTKEFKSLSERHFSIDPSTAWFELRRVSF